MGPVGTDNEDFGDQYWYCWTSIGTVDDQHGACRDQYH